MNINFFFCTGGTLLSPQSRFLINISLYFQLILYYYLLIDIYLPTKIIVIVFWLLEIRLAFGVFYLILAVSGYPTLRWQIIFNIIYFFTMTITRLTPWGYWVGFTGVLLGFYASAFALLAANGSFREYVTSVFRKLYPYN